MDRSPTAGAGDRAPSILDAGCGNGRLAPLVAARLASGFEYLGVDRSPALLACARRRPGTAGRLVALDLVAWPAAAPLPGQPFDFVAVFGLLHHVAGRARRRRLLASLAGRLAPGGLLAVSFWQFADRDRFRRRIVPWPQAAARGGPAVAAGDLEPGDHLLAWGPLEPPAGGEPALRYCHHAGDAEARGLVSGLGLEIVDRYRADGRSGDLNLYYLLRRRPL